MARISAVTENSQQTIELYSQLSVLYGQAEKILGRRLACIYAYTLACASDSPALSNFFEKTISDTGENPSSLALNVREKKLVDFGKVVAKYYGNIANHVYDVLADDYNKKDMLILAAFTGQMIGINIFNNVIEDDMNNNSVLHLSEIFNTRH